MGKKINRTRKSRNTVRRRNNRTQTTGRKSRGRKVTGRKVTGRKVTGRKSRGRKSRGRKSTRYQGGEGGRCKAAHTRCRREEKQYGSDYDCDNALHKCRRPYNRDSWWTRTFTKNPAPSAVQLYLDDPNNWGVTQSQPAPPAPTYRAYSATPTYSTYSAAPTYSAPPRERGPLTRAGESFFYKGQPLQQVY